MNRSTGTSWAHDAPRSEGTLLTDQLVRHLLDAQRGSSLADEVESCSESSVALLQNESQPSFAANLAASRGTELVPPQAWASAVRQLTNSSHTRAPDPAWWTPRTAFLGGIETRTDPTSYQLDGMKRLGPKDSPAFYFQLTLAGWGCFKFEREAPRLLTPGKALFATAPSLHRCYLPEESPGWTFAWIGVYHPYLVSRVAKLVSRTGPVIDVQPDSTLVASALRLVRGAMTKDFCDEFALELALFDFVLVYARWAHEAGNSSHEGLRLLEEIRSRIVASLPKAIAVETLAAEYGLTRSHFSHFFRNRTGLTPGHFATEVRIQEAARMLLDTRKPLKSIADACGFANANHFGKVFRRLRHLSPGAYRQTMQ